MTEMICPHCKSTLVVRFFGSKEIYCSDCEKLSKMTKSNKQAVDNNRKGRTK